MARDRRSYLAAHGALSARVLIEAWLEDIGVGVEHADALARRLHAATIPFDSDPETVERCVIDSILWMADCIDGDPAAATRLRATAAAVSASFVAAGLVSEAYCVLPDGGEPEANGIGGYATPGSADGEGEGRPMRYDLVYARPVRVRLSGKRCIVRFPPFDGRVRVEGEGKRPAVVAVDDLDDDAGRRSLASSPVKPRLELHVRCSVRHCGKALRAWLDADRLTVENTKGETICDLAELAHMRCDLHDDTA